MSHYIDNDPNHGAKGVHPGKISQCAYCNEHGEYDDFEDGDEVPVKPEHWVTPVGSVGEVFNPPAASAPETPLPKWTPPAVTDSGEPPAQAGPSLVVANPGNEDGSLPGVIQTKLPQSSALPPGARKRWNVAEITGPDQTEFKVRRGDDPVRFVVVGTKQDAVDVVVALSLVDRVDRNCMRVALIAKPELLAELPADVKEGFDKHEVAKGHEFMSWLRKRGRSMLAMGSRPWQGKVGGAAPDVHSALKALGLGNPGGNGGDAN